MIRRKNSAFAMLIVTAEEIRQILRNGSRRFSNELAFAATNALSKDCDASGWAKMSSTRAVSSCNLRIEWEMVSYELGSIHQANIASKALTWKYGSSKSFKYIDRPSCCHNSILQLFPALARSQRIGRANCLSGELVSMTRFKQEMIPAWAASSWRDLFKRHKLKQVWKTWFATSYVEYK